LFGFFFNHDKRIYKTLDRHDITLN